MSPEHICSHSHAMPAACEMAAAPTVKASYSAGPVAAQVVTRTASQAGGAGADCAPNVRAAFAALFNSSATSQGRALVSRQLSLCEGALNSEADATLVGMFLLMGFDTAAMGSYPYPSSYFTGRWAAHLVPPMGGPVVRACSWHAGSSASFAGLLAPQTITIPGAAHTRLSMAYALHTRLWVASAGNPLGQGIQPS